MTHCRGDDHIVTELDVNLSAQEEVYPLTDLIIFIHRMDTLSFLSTLMMGLSPRTDSLNAGPQHVHPVFTSL